MENKLFFCQYGKLFFIDFKNQKFIEQKQDIDYVQETKEFLYMKVKRKNVIEKRKKSDISNLIQSYKCDEDSRFLVDNGIIFISNSFNQTLQMINENDEQKELNLLFSPSHMILDPSKKYLFYSSDENQIGKIDINTNEKLFDIQLDGCTRIIQNILNFDDEYIIFNCKGNLHNLFLMNRNTGKLTCLWNYKRFKNLGLESMIMAREKMFEDKKYIYIILHCTNFKEYPNILKISKETKKMTCFEDRNSNTLLSIVSIQNHSLICIEEHEYPTKEEMQKEKIFKVIDPLRNFRFLLYLFAYQKIKHPLMDINVFRTIKDYI